MQSLVESIQKDKEMGHVDVKIHLLENSRQMQKMQAERIPLPVVHHSNLSDFATNVGTDPVIILAHEYFDALPIFRFQYKPGVGWCEEMIDIAPELDTRTVIGTSRRARVSLWRSRKHRMQPRNSRSKSDILSALSCHLVRLPRRLYV